MTPPPDPQPPRPKGQTTFSGQAKSSGRQPVPMPPPKANPTTDPGLDPVVSDKLAPWEDAPESKPARPTQQVVKKPGDSGALKAAPTKPSQPVQKPNAPTQKVAKPPTLQIPAVVKPIAELGKPITAAVESLKKGVASYEVRQQLLHDGVAESQVVEVLAIARDKAGVPATSGQTKFYLDAPGVEVPSAAARVRKQTEQVAKQEWPTAPGETPGAAGAPPQPKKAGCLGLLIVGLFVTLAGGAGAVVVSNLIGKF